MALFTVCRVSVGKFYERFCPAAPGFGTSGGAEFAEVYQGSSVSHPVTFEANRLKQLETAESIGTALRLWYQGRPGLAVAYGHVAPQLLVEKAIALSQLQEPTPLEVCEPRRDINPPIGTAMAVETLVEKGKVAIAQLRDHYPDILCSGVFDCESSHTLLVNSEGLYCTAADISLSYGLEVEWVRGMTFWAFMMGILPRIPSIQRQRYTGFWSVSTGRSKIVRPPQAKYQ